MVIESNTVDRPENYWLLEEPIVFCQPKRNESLYCVTIPSGPIIIRLVYLYCKLMQFSLISWLICHKVSSKFNPQSFFPLYHKLNLIFCFVMYQEILFQQNNSIWDKFKKFFKHYQNLLNIRHLFINSNIAITSDTVPDVKSR